MSNRALTPKAFFLKLIPKKKIIKLHSLIFRPYGCFIAYNRSHNCSVKVINLLASISNKNITLKMKKKKVLGMSCQEVYKQGRNDIKVKVIILPCRHLVQCYSYTLLRVGCRYG